MRRTVLLLLLIAGTVLPLVQFLPWLTANGIAVREFVDELFANRISSFFGWDVIVSALVVVVLAVTDSGLDQRRRAAVIAGTLLVGVSCGLPLWALLRATPERA